MLLGSGSEFTRSVLRVAVLVVRMKAVSETPSTGTWGVDTWLRGAGRHSHVAEEEYPDHDGHQTCHLRLPPQCLVLQMWAV